VTKEPVAEQPATGQPVIVWQAGLALRLAAYGGMIVLAVLAWRLVAIFGFTATIAVLFAVGVCVSVYWGVLRPKLVAGSDGVRVVLGRRPVTVAWRDIRRCDAGPTGLTIRVTGGNEVSSRWPQRDRGAKPGDTTEADLAAAYLVRRAEWARKPTGPVPAWAPPPPRPKPAK
jgi:hypothetical protein